MPTKTVQIDSLQIAYRQSSGKGPAVLLLHGNSASSRVFQPQLESPLGEKYRLVAIDLPGHGNSSNASEPAAVYNPFGYTAFLVKIAKQLGLERAVFVGWSLGGHIVLEAIPQLPQAAGFMVFGTPPLAVPPNFEQAFLPNPAMAAAFQADLTDAQADAFAQACFRPGVPEIPAVFHQDIRRTDGQARAMLAAGIQPGSYLDETAIIAQMSAPLAIVHGEQEQLVSLAYLQTLTAPTLWRGSVQIIPEAGHAANWEQPEQFNALLDAFIQGR